MRDYGKVQTSFWTSTTMRSLTDDGRMLALYLITSPHSTIAGVFRLPDGYVCEDLQWSAERVREGFLELFRKGFSNRCETTKWVWVCAHLEWNPPENPNQRKSAAKVAAGIPDECGWKPDFMRVCGPLLDLPPWSPPNACATLSKGFSNQEQEQEQEQDSPSLRSGVATTAPSPAPAKPKKNGVTLKTYLEQCRAEGRKPLPPDHFIRGYCRDAGISDEMLQVAWIEFRDRFATGMDKAKLQKDWPAHFANAVKGRWAKLWFVNDRNEVEWSATGLQAKRVIEARMHAQAQAEEGEHASA